MAHGAKKASAGPRDRGSCEAHGHHPIRSDSRVPGRRRDHPRARRHRPRSRGRGRGAIEGWPSRPRTPGAVDSGDRSGSRGSGHPAMGQSAKTSCWPRVPSVGADEWGGRLSPRQNAICTTLAISSPRTKGADVFFVEARYHRSPEARRPARSATPRTARRGSRTAAGASSMDRRALSCLPRGRAGHPAGFPVRTVEVSEKPGLLSLHPDRFGQDEAKVNRVSETSTVLTGSPPDGPLVTAEGTIALADPIESRRRPSVNPSSRCAM